MSSVWYAGTAAEPALDIDERRQLKRFEMICGHFARLERMVNGEVKFELPANTSSRASMLEGPAVAQGSKLAQMERERLNLGDNPLDEIESVFDSMGIKIVGLRLPESSTISGGFFFESDIGPCIMVNASLSLEEQLFSAAHQYCHFLADYNPYLPRLCYCGVPVGDDPSEERATGFAGGLLLPEASLAALMNGNGAVGTKARDLQALGVYYGVPTWAVAHRLRQIGLDISPVGENESFEVEASENGPERDLPRRFVRLALEARSCDLVTRLRMARLLQMDLPAADELYLYFCSRDDNKGDEDSPGAC